jgi:UDP-N-acetylglucosamine/UDP-N-acetylgalactosamine diphosphorylase
MSLEVTLKKFGQEHLLRHMAKLERDERTLLEAQLATIDFSQLQRLVAGEETGPNWAELAARAEPPPAIRLNDPQPKFSLDDAQAAGEKAIRDGKLATIIVAGGQGTRLGFEHPKGMFPIGPLSGRTLFQMLADRLLAVMKRYGVSIPMYIMTSPATDAETRQYFADNQRCGLAEDQLVIFCQGTMPAVEAGSGKLLLETRSSLALSPDGHGGLVSALNKSGCLADAAQRGVEHFFYAQVDNPLVQLCDPALIGYHGLSASQVTTQVVRKRFAKEKVGNVVGLDGKVQIIEYSDLPDSAAEQTLNDGSLKLWAGNIAVHLFERKFLQAVVENTESLAFHRAHKAVPHLNEALQLVQPEKPNAIKFERFVFDLLPLAVRSIVVEGNAADVFAPVKNADGAAVDTPEQSKAALCGLHRSWLESAGATIMPEVKVEIHPAWALDAAEVRKKVGNECKISADTFFRRQRRLRPSVFLSVP